MQWVVLMENIVMISGFGLMSGSLYFIKKQQIYQKMFADLRKCPKYHLDYVEEVDSLPRDKKVILFGTAKHQKGEEEIARSFINKSKGEGEDRLWNVEFRDYFRIQTSGKQAIEVKSEGGTDILAFNWFKRGEDGKVQERVLCHRQPVCVYGMLTKTQLGGRRMAPQILMGVKHEGILKYLDEQMVRLNARGKRVMLAGGVLVGLHFGYKIWMKRLEQQRQMQRVLEETVPSSKDK